MGILCCQYFRKLNGNEKKNNMKEKLGLGGRQELTHDKRNHVCEKQNHTGWNDNANHTGWNDNAISFSK